MKKTFFFAALLAAASLAFTACNKNNDGNKPDEPQNPETQSLYEGIWVSDSILDGTDLYPHAVMWEVLNDHEIMLHGWGKCVWQMQEEALMVVVVSNGSQLSMIQTDYNKETRTAVYQVVGGATLLNVPEDAMLYMYRLPQPEGNNLPVTEANILGKWRTTYEVNADYDADGNRVDETRFYHDYSIWEIKANGAAVSYSDPYSYDGWWVLDDGKLALYTGEKPATMKADYFFNVELKSNYMHLTRYNYNEAGKITSSNEQFFYRK